MSKVWVQKCLCILAAVFLAAMFQTLLLKANIGVLACWDSIGMNLYEIFRLKVGTCSMLLESICVVAQVFLLRKEFHWIRWMQLPLAVLYGWVMNLFYYQIFTFSVNSYGMRIFLCLLADVGMAVFLGLPPLSIRFPRRQKAFVLQLLKNAEWIMEHSGWDWILQRLAYR